MLQEGRPPKIGDNLKKGKPTPWLIVREIISDAWRIAPFEVPVPGDREHDLADEVGRWIEVEMLKQKYPLYR